MQSARSSNLLGALALSLVDKMNTAVVAAAGSSGETPAALITLAAEPGLSINALRQILKLSHPGTVRLIDRLAAQGLVERRAGTDGRTLALFLTPAGDRRCSDLLAARRRPLQQAVDTLSEAEQHQLTQLLETLLTAMTTSELEAFAICRLCETAVCPSDRCPVEQKYCQLTTPCP